jgi:hypothetical protein
MSSDPNAIVIIEPVTVTDSILDASGSPPATNVPEDDFPEWDPATTYAEGDRVILASTHRIYESLLNGNTNNDPTVISSPIYWIEVGPTNRWAVFDTSVSTQTRQANNITYTFNLSSIITSVALLNITQGSQVNITLTNLTDSPPTVAYDEEFELGSLPASSDWWTWFFGERRQQIQLIVRELPVVPNAQLKIEILGGSDLGVGVIMFGQEESFGLGIKYGARVGIQDYSRKETNEFGDTILVRRAFAKRATVDVFLDNDELDAFQNTLADIRAVPVLWILSERFDSTTLFGFYKNFDILINYPDHSDCTLEIEGLT